MSLTIPTTSSSNSSRLNLQRVRAIFLCNSSACSPQTNQWSNKIRKIGRNRKRIYISSRISRRSLLCHLSLNSFSTSLLSHRSRSGICPSRWRAVEAAKSRGTSDRWASARLMLRERWLRSWRSSSRRRVCRVVSSLREGCTSHPSPHHTCKKQNRLSNLLRSLYRRRAEIGWWSTNRMRSWLTSRTPVTCSQASSSNLPVRTLVQASRPSILRKTRK